MGGGPKQAGHLLLTYAVVCVLAIVGRRGEGWVGRDRQVCAHTVQMVVGLLTGCCSFSLRRGILHMTILEKACKCSSTSGELFNAPRLVITLLNTNYLSRRGTYRLLATATFLDILTPSAGSQARAERAKRMTLTCRGRRSERRTGVHVVCPRELGAAKAVRE